MLNSHVVSCGFAICPIMPSTASVAMKLLFGVKPGRFFMRSTIWIAASHRRECGVSVLAVNKHYQASSAKSVEGNTASGLLAMARSSFERALIVVEGLYSMDGDYPDLPRLIEIKSRHNAWLILDEAHALGVLGQRGYGTAEHFGIDPRRADIWMGTLSKTLAGCGGYIAGCHELVEYLRLTVGVFVYSVGMPPVIAASTLKALEILHREPERVHNLQRNGAVFRSWHLVFVVTALMNFIVVGLALFVLKPLRLRQLGQGSSARQRLLRRHNRRARLAALSLKSTPCRSAPLITARRRAGVAVARTIAVLVPATAATPRASVIRSPVIAPPPRAVIAITPVGLRRCRASLRRSAARRRPNFS